MMLSYDPHPSPGMFCCSAEKITATGSALLLLWGPIFQRWHLGLPWGAVCLVLCSLPSRTFPGPSWAPVFLSAQLSHKSLMLLPTPLCFFRVVPKNK